MIEAMFDMCARLPGERLISECLAHSLAENLQAVQLVVGFEEIDALGAIVREMHGFGPLLAGGPVAVYGDEAVGGEDGVPEGVLGGVVGGAVFGVPPELFVDGWDFFLEG